MDNNGGIKYYFDKSQPVFHFISESFPDFTLRHYRKIMNGRRFEGWVRGVYQGQMVCCVALFRREHGYHMGLFCVSPYHRRQKIGQYFYHYLVNTYGPLTWTALTPASISFYQSLPVVKVNEKRGLDGRIFTYFQSQN